MTILPSTHDYYLWKGVHPIRYTSRKDFCSSRGTVVFVHGFGASFEQFRDNIPAFAKEGFDVFGIDLLGFGGSAKPLPSDDVIYSIDMWSDLLSDFLEETVRPKPSMPIFLVGNSIGSLVCTNLASRPAMTAVSGVVALNCAGGMNSKLLLNEPGISPITKTLLLRPLLSFFDLILTSQVTRSIAQDFFDKFRSRENVLQVLQQVYVNAERVDEELLRQILAPAEDPNAFQVFCAILSGDAGPHPTQIFPLLEKKGTPVCFVWGQEDPWTPLSGDTAQYMRGFASRTKYTGSSFTVLENIGHCPHDDNPETVNQAVLSWLDGTDAGSRIKKN